MSSIYYHAPALNASFVTNSNAAPLYYMIKNLNKSMCEKPWYIIVLSSRCSSPTGTLLPGHIHSTSRESTELIHEIRHKLDMQEFAD